MVIIHLSFAFAFAFASAEQSSSHCTLTYYKLCGTENIVVFFIFLYYLTFVLLEAL